MTEQERYERRCASYKKYRANRSPEKKAQALKMRRLWKAAHRDRVREQNNKWYRGAIVRDLPPLVRELRVTVCDFTAKYRREFER